MENLQYTKLKEHIGHNLSLVEYGNGVELSIECDDCCQVLYSEEPEIELE